MALNIGTIQFGIDANTKGLKKAAREIQKFRDVVTKTAKAQADAGKRVDTALGRQESAMKKAFQATKQLQQGFQRLGLEEKEMAEKMKPVESALNRYIKELKSGKLNTIEMTRAQDGFAAKMNRSKRALKEMQDELAKGRGSKLVKTLRNLESASVFAVGPLSGLGARIRSFGAIAGRTKLKIAALIGAFTGLVVGFGKLIAAGVRSNIIMEKMEARFRAVSGGARGAARELAFLDKVVTKFGLDLQTTGTAYSRFVASTQGTALEGSKARQVFENMTAAIAGLRLTAHEAERVFRALEQIMSKGTVQAEEIRGQLGDVLPGAFRIAAKSAGVTTQEFNRLLKQGKVLSDDFVVPFSKAAKEAFGKEATENVKTFTGSFALLANEFNRAARAADDFIHASDIIITSMRLTTIVLAAQRKQWNELFGDVPTETSKLAQAARDFAEKWQAAFDAAYDKQLGQGFSEEMQKIGDEITETGTQLELLAKSAHLLKMGLSKGLIDHQVTAEMELATASGAELREMAMRLSKFLGFVVPRDVESVVAALAVLRDALDRTDESMGQTARGLETRRDAWIELADMHDRFKAMSGAGGLEALKVYDEITQVQKEWVRNLVAGGMAQDEANRLGADFLAILTKTVNKQAALKLAEDQRKDALQEHNRLIKARERAEERARKALEKSNQTLHVMKQRVAAIARGPDSLMIFEKITRPVEQFKFQLQQQGVQWHHINQQVAQYKKLLQQSMNLQGPFAQAGVSAAQAIGNALEDVLSMTKSLKDGFKSLLEELWRIALRVLFIDPLVKGLQTTLTNIMTQGGTQGGVGFMGILGKLFPKQQQPPLTPVQTTAKKIPPGGTIASAAAGPTAAAMKAAGVQLQTAATTLTTAGTQLQTASTQAQTASTQLQTSATQLQTVPTQLNSSVVSMQTVITRAMTAMHTAITNASTKLQNELSMSATALTEAAAALKAAAEHCAKKCETCCQGNDNSELLRLFEKVGGVGSESTEFLGQLGGKLDEMFGGQADASEGLSESATQLSGAGMGLDAGAGKLSDSSTELMAASKELGRTAEMMYIAKKVEKADRWFNLIQKGVQAYGMSGGGGFGGEGGGDISSIFGGGMALGGRVEPGKIYQVNERGPEMYQAGGRQYLMPNEGGRVEPLTPGGSKGDTYNTTINVPPERRRRTVQQEAYLVGREMRRTTLRNR